MIRIHQVTKLYKTGKKEVQALENISLQIEEGDIFGIIGHSGAGKSTLLRLMNGLEKPSDGEIYLDESPLHQLSTQKLRIERQKIGMIFQHFHLLWSRTVWENVAFPLEIAGLSKEEIKKRVEEVLTAVGLQDRVDSYPSQLSGGQKQRVGIARALANRPKLLLCDEATSALDPETTRSILQLLKEINQKTGITIVLITHQMDVITSICDKVAVLADGKLVETGTVKEVLVNPQHEITRKFLLQEGNIENLDSLIVSLSKWEELKEIVKEKSVQIQSFVDPITQESKLKIQASPSVLEQLRNRG